MKLVVGASKPKHFKIGAWLIMWWEETPASHVYFYFPRLSGIHLLYHAVGCGTQFMGYQKFLEHNTVVFEKEVDIQDGSRQKLLDYLIPKLGTAYSVKHLFGLFMKRVCLYLFDVKIKNIFGDKDKSAVCVDAFSNMLEFQNLLPKDLCPEDMGMQEAFYLLKSIPGVELK